MGYAVDRTFRRKEYIARCSSQQCLTEIKKDPYFASRDSTRAGVRKPNVQYGDIECPDCGCMLFWERELTEKEKRRRRMLACQRRSLYQKETDISSLSYGSDE